MKRLYSALASSTVKSSKFTTQKYNGPSYEQVLAIKANHLTPAMNPFYKKPLVIHRAKMQWMYDIEGNRYLDMFGGIATISVGHCHPKVNAVLHEQIETLWHTTNIYYNPKMVEYASKLASKFPGNLKRVYFVNSGGEANDLAIILARMYTGNYDLISLQNGYHGLSPSTMGLSSMSNGRFPVPNVNSGIIHAMNPDPYQGYWGGQNCRASPVQTDRTCNCLPDNCLAGEKYYKELENVFKYSLPYCNNKLAGMFIESIQGIGGTVQFPKNYVKKAYDLVHKHGGLFIADEIQTGFGRTGDHFWAFQDHGIIPDIVTIAKGIGNGFPLGAVVTTSEIAKVLDKATHFNTFGGNPMACAVASSVLDVIEEENLQQNALKVGTYYLNGLEKLRKKYENVGDVRGKGLMIGVELVEDKKSKRQLSVEKTSSIMEKTKDLGVLFGRGGYHGNIIRIKPSLCINQEHVDMALDVLDRSFAAYCV